MYSKIVVAIDGSEQSFNALRKGLELGSLTGAKVYGFHAGCPGIYSSSYMNADMEAIDPSINSAGAIKQKEIKEILDRGAAIAKEYTCETEFAIEYGDPRDEIIDYAEKIGADLIIAGSKGKNLPKRILLGSVSSAIVTGSKISVLVVK
ncbi:MAG: universal stress protein [Methanomicrobium sp.]|nr:universal stress protein [Methanomicrobium sp.]MBO4522658.1 universal stress protein [Methanomicrobium sp.]MBR6010902.1 universal stress protein [Methanomicrobium sp.]MBR6447972.1 universal stress protein [Methanomicrobium sp.]MBR6497216.1 universal stress protein [Methanomicrobium sp.]